MAAIAYSEIPFMETTLVPAMRDEALEKEIRAATKHGPGVMAHIMSVPWLVRANILAHTQPFNHLSGDMAALILLMVAQHHLCRYCYGAIRAYMKLIGYSETKVQRLELDIHRTDLPESHKRMLEFVRALCRSNPRPGKAALEDLQRAGFSKAAVTEIVYYAADCCTGTRVATGLGFPPDRAEKMVENPIFKIFRPLIAAVMARMKPVRKPEPFPTDNSGPLSEVVEALRDAPSCAFALRTTLDAMWESPVLSKRAKSLAFAVIGRQLGCESSERKARSYLLHDGFASSDVDSVLLHLDSDKLDPIERRFLRFARETVHYRTEQYQARCREFAAGLDHAVIVEAIGVTATANSVGRMSILLDAC